MKNVSLIETNTNKVKSWKLLNNSGELIESFGIFSNLLIKKYSTNTRLSYCRNVALFIDYIEEASNLYKDREFTKSFLVSVIESFPDWLLYGESSGNEISLDIQKTYPSPSYSKQTIDLIVASVRIFLNISERIRMEQENNGELVDSKLFIDANTKELISNNVKNSLVRKSMLGGVVAEGPKLIKACILPISKSQSYFSIERAFPFDKIIPLIDSFPTCRDKSLYMFCAASGCRIHEALQILIEDIDIKNRTVRLVDPNSRITHDSYKKLTPDERSKLSWKGRNTDRVLLIQPFGDLFFEYLEEYIKHEYVAHNKHSFVFQNVRGNQKGKPFFLSSASTRNEAFNKASQKIGVLEELNQGVHSLRHMYGTYLVNYFPKSDGTYGLPLAVVQKLMGHSTINATQRYARHDSELIAIELEYANNLLYKDGEFKSNFLDMKKQAIKSQLLELEKEYNAL